MNHTSTTSRPKDRIQLQGRLLWAKDSILINALVDSGADGNFVDQNLVS